MVRPLMLPELPILMPMPDCGDTNFGDPVPMTRRRWLRAVVGMLGMGCLGAAGLLADPAMVHATSTATPFDRNAARRMATGTMPRVAVLDWGLTEVVLSLGVTPLAIARPTWYRALDGDPSLPVAVTDTGLLYQPNFEVLQALAPELIIVTPWHAPLLPQLRRIAPVEMVAMFGARHDLLALAQSATQQLGDRLNRQAAAAALVAETGQVIAATRATLASRLSDNVGTPMLFFKPIDATHVAVYGENSLFGAVAGRAGLQNAWTGEGDLLGSGQTDLAGLADATRLHDVDRLLAVAIDAPPPLAAAMRGSRLWQVLPFATAGRVVQLNGMTYDGHPFAPFGGLRTAIRFARALTGVLDLTSSHNVASGSMHALSRMSPATPRA